MKHYLLQRQTTTDITFFIFILFNFIIHDETAICIIKLILQLLPLNNKLHNNIKNNYNNVVLHL